LTCSAEAVADYTWSLRETGVLESAFDGSGIRVCVVDSGLEFHPDINLSPGNARSFTQDSSTDDDLGHGTFVAGIICGAKTPQQGPRFGVAPNAELFVAKVFSRAAIACEVSLLAAIEWALQKNCEIISMSLGKPTSGDANPNGFISMAAHRALSLGTLIVAGAGNDSNRQPGHPRRRPVSFPANCAAVMAVGALQSPLKMTDKSNFGTPGTAGAVDLVAPGADVRSAGLEENYCTDKTGTSIATPYVAGIAALYAQACKQARGQALWDLVVRKARPLSDLSVEEAGAGIVRAPHKRDACLCEVKPPCLQGEQE
jgi:subtilisin family serine protease